MSLFPPTPLPPPDATFTVREVARLAGCTVRTVRHYIREKLLIAPTFRSSKTRYDRDFLVRLRAARTLRQERLDVGVVGRRLASMSPEEMLRLAAFDAIPGAPAGSAGAPATAARVPGDLPTSAPAARAGEDKPSASAGLPAGYLGPYRPGAAPPHERWDFFEVCPGVKLLVRSEADPEAWRVATEIVSMFGPRG